MHPSGALNRRSLLITTVAVLTIALPAILPARGEPEPAAPEEPGTTAAAARPSTLPNDGEVRAAAASACAELPLPRVSRSEVSDCERWFADAAAQALVVGVEGGARSQTELALAMCDSPDCAAFVAGHDLVGLSKYEWPRVHLLASLSVTSALAYVTPHVT